MALLAITNWIKYIKTEIKRNNNKVKEKRIGGERGYESDLE